MSLQVIHAVQCKITASTMIKHISLSLLQDYLPDLFKEATLCMQMSSAGRKGVFTG